MKGILSPNTGTLTAQEFKTELNTTTVIATSGSTKFGNTSDDTHQMTGSLKVSGSLTLQNGFSLTPSTTKSKRFASNPLITGLPPPPCDF